MDVDRILLGAGNPLEEIHFHSSCLSLNMEPYWTLGTLSENSFWPIFQLGIYLSLFQELCGVFFLFFFIPQTVWAH